MSDMTVGPIQTYTSNSSLSLPTTSLNPVQGSVSVTLTDSNLWLVDTTKLSGQTGNPATQVTLINLQTKYQTTVPFDNVNFNAATIAPAALTSSESAYLQTSLPEGNSLLLASVTGGTQLDSNGISLTSAGSSGSDTGGLSSSETSGGLSSAKGGSAGAGSGGSGGAGSLSGSGAGASSTGGAGASSSGGAGASSSGGASASSSSASPGGQTAQTATAVTPEATVTSKAIVTPKATISHQQTVIPKTPVPVPFEVSPTIGLLLVLVIFGHKLLLNKISRKPVFSGIELNRSPQR